MYTLSLLFLKLICFIHFTLLYKNCELSIFAVKSIENFNINNSIHKCTIYTDKETFTHTQKARPEKEIRYIKAENKRRKI